MSDDPLVDAASAWLEDAPTQVPTDDERKALANQMREYQAAFGREALAVVVKGVLSKRPGAPARAGEEDARLLAAYREDQARDPSITPGRFAREYVGEWVEPEYLEKRVRRLVKEDDALAALFDEILNREPPDEE